MMTFALLATPLRYLAGFSLLVALASPARADHQGFSHVRERLNKILYWRLTDELKLDPVAEKKMVAVIEEIQKRREAALTERDTVLKDLRAPAAVADERQLNRLLDRYQKALGELAGLDVEEHRRLKEVLKPELLAKFYLVREDVMRLLKDALKATESKPH